MGLIVHYNTCCSAVGYICLLGKLQLCSMTLFTLNHAKMSLVTMHGSNMLYEQDAAQDVGLKRLSMRKKLKWHKNNRS